MNPTIDLIYGSRLRGLRMSRQLVQKQVADLCGFENQQMISLLEKGEKKFTDEIIASVCKGFRLSFEEFTNINSTDNFNHSTLSKNNSDHQEVYKASTLDALQMAHEQILMAKEQAIEAYKQNIKSKDETIAARDREIEKLMIIDKMKDEKLSRNHNKIEELKNELKQLRSNYISS